MRDQRIRFRDGDTVLEGLVVGDAVQLPDGDGSDYWPTEVDGAESTEPLLVHEGNVVAKAVDDDTVEGAAALAELPPTMHFIRSQLAKVQAELPKATKKRQRELFRQIGNLRRALAEAEDADA